jgi:MFS family permease
MPASSLWRIAASQGLSSLGTSMSSVALAFMVNQVTGSVLHMGAVLAVSILPLAAGSWIVGALIDRFGPKRLMVLADAARGLLTLAMPFVAGQSVLLIYIVAVLIGLFSALFNPSQLKLVAEHSARGQLVKANSYLGMSRDGAELIGYLAGGVLVASFGYLPAFAVDAASYLVSAALLARLKSVVARRKSKLSVTALVSDTPSVLGHLWAIHHLRTNLLLALLPLCAIGLYVPNAYGLVLEVFHGGGFELGVLEWAVGCGLIVGGLAMSRVSLAGDKNLYVVASSILVAFCLLGVYFAGNLWLSISLIGLAGMASVGMTVPSITMMQEVSSDEHQGRMIAIRGGFGQLSAAVAYLLGGILGQTIGIQMTFFVAGLSAAILTILIYVPYRITGNRRAETAWKAALDTGQRRAVARQAATEARLGGYHGVWPSGSDTYVEDES